jgi:hypothetical protein
VVSTAPSYHNLKLSTGELAWPIDANDARLQLVPLMEPIGRRERGYPSSWPDNISGETCHTTMASELTALVEAATGKDFVSVHEEVGESGQGMVFLRKGAEAKGVNGRSYGAAMISTQAVARLAKAAGKTYGVGAVVVTHGESDSGNPKYEEELHKLWQDYNSDIPAITGQTQKILMIVSQQNSVWPGSTMAQWKVGVDHPADIVCSGPKYQYPYADDSVHLITEGYRLLGEKYAQVYFERVIRGQPWRPLEPIKAQRHGAVITVEYHVPVAPMVWETQFTPPHASVPEWSKGRGFEVSTADGNKVTITSVAIDGSAVVITCASDPGPNARVSYAMVEEKPAMEAPHHATFRWGLLRDSDPFKGAVTGKAQPNYGVAFEMTVP